MVMVSVARRRYALAVAFACFITLGATSGMLGVAWPSIRAAFGLPLDALVALMIATTISFAIGSVTAGPLIARLGIGWVLLIANVVGFVGCLGYFLAPSWWTLVAFGLLAGWTPGTIITGMNIYVAAIHSVRTMNWMHASFGLGATLGPLLMTAIVGAGLSWGWGYAVAAAVFLALALACLTVVRTMTFRGVEHADDSATTRPSLGATLRLPIVWLSVLMFLLYTGVETTAGQWTYAWFTGTRAASPYVAGVITSIFWAMLTIGRVVFGAGAARIGVERLLRLCMLGAVLAAVLLLPRSLPVGLVAIALLGQTVEAVRLTSAVAGALTVVAVYWLGRTMFDRTTAALAALYLAASHYHIHMSRIALNNVWDGLFGTLAILGLWHGWKTGRRAGFILCGLALGLGQYFYVSIRPLPILFLIWAAVAFWRQRPLFRERFHGLALAALIALVVFLPLGLYFVDKPDEFQAPMNRVTILGQWLVDEQARTGRTATEIVLDNAVKGILGYTHEPLRLLYNPGSPLLLSGAAMLFLLGVLWALLNFDLRYLLLLLPLLAVVASNAFSQDSPASQRYVLAMPLVALFVALPLGQAVAWLRRQYPRYRTAVVAAALALLALVAAVDVNYYFNRVYAQGYVLGGTNTLVATEIAYYLRDKQPINQDVFFFGFPRMGYFSLSTIPFLAPEKQAQDVIEPLTGPAALPIRGPTLFIFLPERLNELPFVQQQAPGGTVQEFRGENGELLFVVYESL